MSVLTEPAIFNTLHKRVDDVLVRICSKLQLSPTQHSSAEESYRAVCTWLDNEDSPLNVFTPTIYPQGSFALGTSVKPLASSEYDVDLVCQLDLAHNDIPQPVILLDMIESQLRQSSIYGPMVERKNRCIRLNYAHNFHMDILPAIADVQLRGTCLLVPDRTTGGWKASNPLGYVSWFEASASRVRKLTMDERARPLPAHERVSEKLPLQLAVQLFKRWRDIHYEHRCEVAPVSIVLTTLAGIHYSGESSPRTALLNIVEKICAAIPARDRLLVLNPENPMEDLSEKWKERESYVAFLSGLEQLRGALHKVNDASDIVESGKLLKMLFGEKLAGDVFADQAREVESDDLRVKLGVRIASSATLSFVRAGAVPVKPHTFYS